MNDPGNNNEVFEQIYRHASVRRYRPDLVPRATVEAIVAAGQRSSTSSNLQMFSVVAVTDPERRLQLAELCGNQAHIAQAPVFLAWCADLSRLERASESRGFIQVSEYTENFLLAAVDAAIAMQTAALAAESLGLGMCYIGAIRNHPLEGERSLPLRLLSRESFIMIPRERGPGFFDFIIDDHDNGLAVHAGRSIRLPVRAA